MNNRKAKFLFAKPGARLRISGRKVVRYAPSGMTSMLPTEYYCIGTKRSAAQNRWKNHCYLVESKGAQV
ncbi:hypothetical protein ACRARH_26085 [Phytobacter ursingii]